MVASLHVNVTIKERYTIKEEHNQDSHNSSYMIVVEEYRNVNIDVEKKNENRATKNAEQETVADWKAAPAKSASHQICIPPISLPAKYNDI